MYVNYYDRCVKLAEESPTIGILLCTAKNDTMVKMSLPEDNKNILLFIIIVIFNEVIIIGGIYFREFYEHKLFEINYQKYEKFYQKRDRYRSLLMYVFGDGKLTIGDKVISGLELKELVREKSTIVNGNKLVDEFLRDMDTLGVFTTNGKRRMIAMQYHEALTVVENYDDALRILENLK